MKFKLNQWVIRVGQGDVVYLGRVKKMVVVEEGTKVFVVFSPGAKWEEFDEAVLEAADFQGFADFQRDTQGSLELEP